MDKSHFNRVLKLVEEAERENVAFLQDLIRARSENPPGKTEEVARVVESKMKELGIETQLVECDLMKEIEVILGIDEFNPEWKDWIEKGDLPQELQVLLEAGVEKKVNVIGVMKGSEEGPTLILNAHLDTVPAGDGWSMDPFEGIVKDGKLFGRGANDNKGGIVMCLAAAAAIKRADIDFKGNLAFAFTVDEETGSYTGAAYLLEKKLLQGDACICADGWADNIQNHIGGFLPFVIVTKGKAVHGTTPSQGVNAVKKMLKIQNIFADVEAELRKQKSKFPSPPEVNEEYTNVVPSIINGGKRFYIVPDRCGSWIDVHIIPDQNPLEVRKMIEERIDRENELDPELDVRIWIPTISKPALTDPSEKIVKNMKSAAKKVLGKDLPTYRVPWLCDARFFIRAGIPTVIYGPTRSEGGAHSPDEWVNISDITNGSKIFALTALQYLE